MNAPDNRDDLLSAQLPVPQLDDLEAVAAHTLAAGVAQQQPALTAAACLPPACGSLGRAPAEQLAAPMAADASPREATPTPTAAAARRSTGA